jgi:transposase
MTRWPTGTHCASWLGVGPGHKVSGGKRSRMRRKPTAHRAARALRLAAQGFVHSPSALGAYERRMRARLGAPKAMTATAHTLARRVESMLRYGTAYVDAGQQAYAQKYRDWMRTNLQRKAKACGSQLVHGEHIDGGVASTL